MIVEDQLRSLIAKWRQTMKECKEDLAEGDRINKEAGTETFFALDPCPSCEEMAEDLPVIEAALEQLVMERQGLAIMGKLLKTGGMNDAHFLAGMVRALVQHKR